MASTVTSANRSGDYRILGVSPGLPQSGPYQAAMDFIRGRIQVEGDFLSAVRAYKRRISPSQSAWLSRWLIRLSQSKPIAWLHGKAAAASDIQYHYDRSDDFYRQFLDSRMVYSCAYFRTPDTPLDDAQLEKLDLICRKLDLQPSDRLLDVGCGWGALLIHAVEAFGARAVGCTLSHCQVKHASELIRHKALDPCAAVRELDYRDLTGAFDKIASVGMFEHVGRSGLAGYFRKIHSLLNRDGLFLNHGIVRRSGAHEDGESMFLQRQVFPGTALVTLPDVIDAAEREGFEILDLENLRPSYALTCRAWVTRLQENEQACRALVGEQTYRTWLLYLAASAVNFEDGYLDVHQMLLARRDSLARPLTRDRLLKSILHRH